MHDVKTRAIITRAQVTTVTMTSALIQAIEAHAADENMKGLTIRTSHGDVLWDSSWTAGVECEDDADDRDCETDAEESDDESEDSSEEEMDADEEISPVKVEEELTRSLRRKLVEEKNRQKQLPRPCKESSCIAAAKHACVSTSYHIQWEEKQRQRKGRRQGEAL